MSFEKFSRSYFGSNLEKAGRNYEAGVACEKLSFQKRYPSADAKDFVFDAKMSKTGDLIRTFTKYRNKEEGLFEFTGYHFKKFYADKLYWQPRIWDPNGTVQPFVLNTDPCRTTLESSRSTRTKRKASGATLRLWKRPRKVPPRTSRGWLWTRTTPNLNLFWQGISSPTWVE